MSDWRQDEAVCYCAELFRAERETNREEEEGHGDGWLTAGDAWTPCTQDDEPAEEGE